MAKIHPYLNFDGTCEAAFLFYKEAFGIENIVLKRANNASMPIFEEEKEKILHAELPMASGCSLYGSDIFHSFGQKLIQGNANHISISAESKEEAERLFKILSEEGEIFVPFEQQFFGYFGSFKDKFGVQWMIHFE